MIKQFAWNGLLYKWGDQVTTIAKDALHIGIDEILVERCSSVQIITACLQVETERRIQLFDDEIAHFTRIRIDQFRTWMLRKCQRFANTIQLNFYRSFRHSNKLFSIDNIKKQEFSKSFIHFFFKWLHYFNVSTISLHSTQ